MSFQIPEATVDDIHTAYESGAITCEEVVKTYLDRIEAYDKTGPELNAIINVNARALEQAVYYDDRLEEEGFVGPLHGIPVIVKDQVETKDVPTTFGSEVFADYQPTTDATLVEKLREAGAVILAKSNLPDWATSWFGYSSVNGRTKNPYDLERDPGGCQVAERGPQSRRILARSVLVRIQVDRSTFRPPTTISSEFALRRVSLARPGCRHSSSHKTRPVP